MSSIPAELKYSAEHEWISSAEAEGVVRIGITDFAQDALGEVVYVEHPEVGGHRRGRRRGRRGGVHKVGLGHLRPVAGEITAVNEELDDKPQVINSDPTAPDGSSK